MCTSIIFLQCRGGKSSTPYSWVYGKALPEKGTLLAYHQNLKFLLFKGAKNRMSTGIQRLMSIKSSELERAEIVMQRLASLLEPYETLAYLSVIKKGVQFFFTYNMKQIAFLSLKVGMFKGKELNLRAEPGTVNTTGDNL